MEPEVYPFILVTMEDGCIIGLANSLGECLYARRLSPAEEIDLMRFGFLCGGVMTQTTN